MYAGQQNRRHVTGDRQQLQNVTIQSSSGCSLLILHIDEEFRTVSLVDWLLR